MPKLIQTHTVFIICKLLTKATCTKIRVEICSFKEQLERFCSYITHDERAIMSKLLPRSLQKSNRE